jgi:hypothetical protein
VVRGAAVGIGQLAQLSREDSAGVEVSDRMLQTLRAEGRAQKAFPSATTHKAQNHTMRTENARENRRQSRGTH